MGRYFEGDRGGCEFILYFVLLQMFILQHQAVVEVAAEEVDFAVAVVAEEAAVDSVSCF
jgi:hypothetical protein